STATVALVISNVPKSNTASFVLIRIVLNYDRALRVALMIRGLNRHRAFKRSTYFAQTSME
ncbi:hypothetical protein N9V62_06925, partial [Porticoccaceae bacterium]|nr:hypothetical protein [Porticoccaceae bacterium]